VGVEGRDRKADGGRGMGDGGGKERMVKDPEPSNVCEKLTPLNAAVTEFSHPSNDYIGYNI
jgi:hypothetical protein